MTVIRRRKTVCKFRLSQKVRATRIEAVLTAPSTALILALFVLGAFGSLLAARIGAVPPGGWMWFLGIGFALAGAKIVLDFRNPTWDIAAWHQVLAERFGINSKSDPSIARLANLVIDIRCRLAELEGTEEVQDLAADTLPALDSWIESIARLARRLSELRRESQFQAALSAHTKDRLGRVETRRKLAKDPALQQQIEETTQAMASQITAAERFLSFYDNGLLQLEHAVAAIGTVSSQLTLVINHGEDIGGADALCHQIGKEVETLEGLLSALDRIAH